MPDSCDSGNSTARSRRQGNRLYFCNSTHRQHDRSERNPHIIDTEKYAERWHNIPSQPPVHKHRFLESSAFLPPALRPQTVQPAGNQSNTSKTVIVTQASAAHIHNTFPAVAALCAVQSPGTCHHRSMVPVPHAPEVTASCHEPSPQRHWPLW